MWVFGAQKQKLRIPGGAVDGGWLEGGPSLRLAWLRRRVLPFPTARSHLFGVSILPPKVFSLGPGRHSIRSTGICGRHHIISSPSCPSPLRTTQTQHNNVSAIPKLSLQPSFFLHTVCRIAIRPRTPLPPSGAFHHHRGSSNHGPMRLSVTPQRLGKNQLSWAGTGISLRHRCPPYGG
jgi:hypothetical protein